MSEPLDADEIIPPSRSKKIPFAEPEEKDESHQAVAQIVAHWLDELFHIPGTKIKVGLDPIISLIPGIGDIITSSVSFVVMLEAVRQRVPLSTIIHMGFNVVVNALMDMVPGAGPAVSIFFRSNSRNLELLNRWKAGEHRQVRSQSRWVVGLVVCMCFLMLLALLSVWVMYVLVFAHWMGWL